MTKQKKFFTKNINIFIFAVVCTLLWGSAFPCVKIGYELFGIGANDIFSKILFAGIRFFAAGVFVVIFKSVKDRKVAVPPKENLRDVISLGLVQTTLQYLFFYIGLANTTGVKGSVIDATSTFFAIIMAHFLFKNDKLNVKKIIGCTAGILGAIVINLTDGFDLNFNLSGDGMILVSALAFAGSTVMIKAFSDRCEPIMLTGWQMIFGASVLIVIALVGGGAFHHVTAQALLLLLYMSLLSSVAFVLWNLLLKYNKVGKITLYSFLIPVFGAILSAIFLNENVFTFQNLAALVLVSAGIFIVNK